MTEWIVDGKFMGLRQETDRHVVVFGSRHLTKDDLSRLFPEWKFCFLRQVHGRTVVRGHHEELFEADGHWTNEPGVALVIQTADCLPILLAGEGQVSALHAGWRGVAQNIVEAVKPFWRETPRKAFLGPHIQFESFEIGLDVANQLESTHIKFDEKWCKPHTQPNKCYFHLAGLVKAQLTHAFPSIQVLSLSENTLIDPRFHSFRRDGERAGRQLSFIVMKP